MNILEKPQALSFAADLQDYKIDSEKTITFDVRIAEQRVLAEEYSPDGNYIIRTRHLGKLCAAALWGKLPKGLETHQDNLMRDFTFDIDGVADTTATVIASRCKARFTPSQDHALTLCDVRTTHIDSPEWLSFYLESGQEVVATLTDLDGISFMKVLYKAAAKEVVTLDVCAHRICALFPSAEIVSYRIGNVLFRIDRTRYFETVKFRYLNNFDVCEAVTATGEMTSNAASKNTDAFLDGVERRVASTSMDEYTVNSGVIFRQSDFIIWHELIKSRRVQVMNAGEWKDIIITKNKFERSNRKNILKQVSVSFRLADPEEGALYD